MKTPFRNNFRAAHRAIYVLLSLVMLVGIIIPLFNLKAAAAGSQLLSREIKMSDSGASSNGIATGVGSGTAVTYRVQFTAATTAHSLVIDFCNDSPIIADSTCFTTANTMDTSAATLVQVGSDIIKPTSAGGFWTASHVHTSGISGQESFKIADDGSHPITAGVHTFDIVGVTNPTTVGTFYARIYSYTSNIFDNDNNGGTGADNWTGPSSPGTYLDYGGIALSTTQTITISARVQEALTFCVTSSDPANWTTAGPNIHSCADTVVGANLPALTIGTGSPTKVLSATTVDTGNVYTQLSTNATNGAIVRIRNSNTACGGLSADSGTTCSIAPVALLPGGCTIGTNCAAQQVQNGATSGISAFGLFASDGVDDPGTGGGPTLNTVNSSSCTSPTEFHVASHAKFDPNHTADADTYYGMPYQVSNVAGVTSPFGADIVRCTQPVYRVDNYYQFAVTPTLSTPAGIYKANLSMIATATF
jgi:hypothetical protein